MAVDKTERTKISGEKRTRADVPTVLTQGGQDTVTADKKWLQEIIGNVESNLAAKIDTVSQDVGKHTV